jgi:iron(III) transport system ATP-binding protein
MEARLLGRASLIHLSVPAGTEELHFHARVPGLNSLKTGSPVRITVDTAQAFVFPANE